MEATLTVNEPTMPAERAKAVTAFLCANCARPTRKLDFAESDCPSPPKFNWGLPVQEILVACTGRLQPEHVLKAFESGADLVFTVSCEVDDCLYHEGSERWSRRADYLRDLLDEIGLGRERLLVFHLPGTTAGDLLPGAGLPTPACPPETTDERFAAIRDEVTRAVDDLAPNPLHKDETVADEAAEELLYQQSHTGDEDNED